eukprot:TRINITY_DN6557_c0_g1_i3.p1 TRINITY_DN6557_c0_g1~~TRINITY_DN6557_c0_g1_i3.p1  ORF type:complete len:274 (+),score=32.73 TRINITY_DN6557_c0_g1_i3:112-933(+)
MGQLLCCCADRGEFNAVNKNKNARINNWRATGVVSLRDAKLRELPIFLVDFAEQVISLDATNNKISSLPEFVSHMVSLQRLILTKNVLTSLFLPGGFGSLDSLKILILDHNKLSDLPEDLYMLQNLENLSLHNNCLSQLSDNIGHLQKLKQFNASSNKLLYLSEGLGHCRNLDEINCSNNFLKSIPESFGRLNKLKVLNLDNNRIGNIPSSVLTDCESLQTLSLHQNPISLQVLQQTEGFAEFENRRKSKFDKIIGSGVLLGSSGVDQGADSL